MAGLLTHLIIVVVVGVIIFLFSKKWIYSLAFILGHLIPDLISFGIAGIKMGSLNPGEIMTHLWFPPLAAFSHNIFNWAIIALAIFLVFGIFYFFKKISKNDLKIWAVSLIFFLAGVAIHLIIDIFIMEKSYWI